MQSDPPMYAKFHPYPEHQRYDFYGAAGWPIDGRILYSYPLQVAKWIEPFVAKRVCLVVG